MSIIKARKENCHPETILSLQIKDDYFKILGPIVQSALDAAEAVERKVKLYAVEKNPYAVVTLLTLKEEKWGDSVEVISSDMREWKPTQDQVIEDMIQEALISLR